MPNKSLVTHLFAAIREVCIREFISGPTPEIAKGRVFQDCTPTTPFYRESPSERLERSLAEAYISGWFDGATDNSNR